MVFALAALLPGPRFDESAVDREVLVREQAALAGLPLLEHRVGHRPDGPLVDSFPATLYLWRKLKFFSLLYVLDTTLYRYAVQATRPAEVFREMR